MGAERLNVRQKNHDFDDVDSVKQEAVASPRRQVGVAWGPGLHVNKSTPCPAPPPHRRCVC